MKKLLLILVLTASTAHAQWKPDRADYEVLNDGNFYTTAHDMKSSMSPTLKRYIDTPLFNYFHKDSQAGFVYIVYVTRTKTGYVIWFRSLPDVPVEFDEEYAVLEYEGPK